MHQNAIMENVETERTAFDANNKYVMRFPLLF